MHIRYPKKEINHKLKKVVTCLQANLLPDKTTKNYRRQTFLTVSSWFSDTRQIVSKDNFPFASAEQTNKQTKVVHSFITSHYRHITFLKESLLLLLSNTMFMWFSVLLLRFITKYRVIQSH